MHQAHPLFFPETVSRRPRSPEARLSTAARRLRPTLAAVALILLGAVRPAAAPHEIPNLKWRAPRQGKQIIAALLERGRPEILALAAKLAPQGKGDDANVRFALHGLALAAAAPETPAPKRAAIRSGFIAAAAARRDPQVRAFLLRQLRFVAAPDCIHAMAAYLANPQLCNPALAVIENAGAPETAAPLLLQALRQAPKPCRVPLILALGRIRASKAVPALTPLLDRPDRELRMAAMDALAQIGPVEAVPAFLKLARTAPHRRRYEQTRILEAGVRFAQALARNAGTTAAADFLLKFAQTPAWAQHPNARAAILDAWVHIDPDRAAAKLARALQSNDSVLRAAALRIGAGLPPERWAKTLVALLPQLHDPQAAAAVVTALGRVRTPESRTVLEKALTTGAPPVRHAAFNALAAAFGSAAGGELLDAVAQGRLATVPPDALARVLARIATPQLAVAAARRLPKAVPAGQIVLSRVLARAPDAAKALLPLLDSPNRSVRRNILNVLADTGNARIVPGLLAHAESPKYAGDRGAAMHALAAICRRDPQALDRFLAERAAMAPERRAAWTRLLARIGGQKAWKTVAAELDAADRRLRTAAERAAMAWPDAAAAPRLARIFAKSQNPKQRLIILRGLVRALARGNLPPDAGEPAEFAIRLWNTAQNDSERRLLLSLMGRIHDARILRTLQKTLAQPTLRPEAAAAVLAATQTAPGRTLFTTEAWSALKTLAAGAKQNPAGIPADLARNARQRLFHFPATAALGNLALGKPVKTDVPTEPPHVPAAAVDGRLGRFDAWFGHTSPAHLIVDLQQTTAVAAVRVIFYWDGARYYQYTVEASRDGKKWKRLVDASKNTKPATPQGVLHKFPPATARYLRLSVIHNSANPAVHVVEFEAYPAGAVPNKLPAGNALGAAGASEPLPKTPLPPPGKDGFIRLFNGKDLRGWIGDLRGYTVQNGAMVCKKGSGGKLYTEHQFRDFIFKFDFKLDPGANNGVAIRAPLAGNAAYAGMEIQIIDNKGYWKIHHYKLRPYQVHGSIYGVVPAKTGALKPAGQWNHEEIRALGPRITVIVNGKTIVDADLDAVRNPADGHGLAGHPGLKRTRGHVGWLGHGDRVAFRNVFIKPLDYCAVTEKQLPPGFTPLFNGKNLDGWKGLVGNPRSRAAMNPNQLAKAQKIADALMRAHWKVENGILCFDGKGASLCTRKDYRNFELFVDWKISPGGDSGIYLRGSPQVQIWDFHQHPEGSGGLFNNRKHPNKPRLCADRPIGKWNRFRIRMRGDKVSVWLNGWKVVDNVVMENYWDRSRPIYPSGQIELQSHHSPLWFRRIYLHELPDEPKK